jgi:hypothetical protein
MTRRAAGQTSKQPDQFREMCGLREQGLGDLEDVRGRRRGERNHHRQRRRGSMFQWGRWLDHRGIGRASAGAASAWRTRSIATVIRAGVTSVAASILLAPTRLAILVLMGLAPAATGGLGARRNPAQLQDDQEPEEYQANQVAHAMNLIGTISSTQARFLARAAILPPIARGRPFRHEARSPRVRTQTFPVRPPDLRRFYLVTRASRPVARSPRSTAPPIRFLSLGPRVRSTLPSDGRSPSRPCASLPSL